MYLSELINESSNRMADYEIKQTLSNLDFAIANTLIANKNIKDYAMFKEHELYSDYASHIIDKFNLKPHQADKLIRKAFARSAASVFHMNESSNRMRDWEKADEIAKVKSSVIAAVAVDEISYDTFKKGDLYSYFLYSIMTRRNIKPHQADKLIRKGFIEGGGKQLNEAKFIKMDDKDIPTHIQKDRASAKVEGMIMQHFNTGPGDLSHYDWDVFKENISLDGMVNYLCREFHIRPHHAMKIIKKQHAKVIEFYGRFAY